MSLNPTGRHLDLHVELEVGPATLKVAVAEDEKEVRLYMPSKKVLCFQKDVLLDPASS